MKRSKSSKSKNLVRGLRTQMDQKRGAATKAQTSRVQRGKSLPKRTTDSRSTRAIVGLNLSCCNTLSLKISSEKFKWEGSFTGLRLLSTNAISPELQKISFTTTDTQIWSTSPGKKCSVKLLRECERLLRNNSSFHQ